MTRRERQELIDKGLLLPLMEEFYTIQGEGFHSGKNAVFIRFSGCNLWNGIKKFRKKSVIIYYKRKPCKIGNLIYLAKTDHYYRICCRVDYFVE